MISRRIAILFGLFNEDLSGLKLRFATAQPLAKVGTAKEPVYVFFAQPGIKPEFVVENAPGLKPELSVESTGGVATRDGAMWFPGLQPGQRGDSIRFTLAGGHHVTLLLLDQKEAEQAWKIRVGGNTALISTPQQAFVDGAFITLEDLGAKTFEANIIPEGAMRAVAVDPGMKLGHSGADVTATSSSAAAAIVPVIARETKPPGEVAPLPADFKPSGRPRVVAGAPADADWSRAGTWTLTLPKTAPSTGEKMFLRIKYEGDVMRLSASGKLLDDNFADGRPWLVGLERFAPQLQKSDLNLSIYPLRKDAPIFFEPGLEPKVEGTQAATLESVELVTQYSLKLRMEAPRAP